jgi:cytochrome b pre-mRNA-processing protein 3
MFFRLFSKNRSRRKQVSQIAEDIYSCALLNTRERFFYERGGVPDTFDGRFDLLLVHIFIIFHLLMAGTRFKNKAVLQALFDRMFDDMDQSLREMGAGDIGVSRQIKRMMDAFNGRMQAYQEAVISDTSEDLIEQALLRNLYGTVQSDVDPNCLSKMKSFVEINIADNRNYRVEKILRGDIVFDNHMLNREKEQAVSNKSKKSL